MQREEHDYLGGNYELPGGDVEENENFLESVRREFSEETGLEVIAITGMFEGFDYSTAEKLRVRQLNFIAIPTGNELRLDPDEHPAYLWSGPNDYQDLPMPNEIKVCLKNTFDLIRLKNSN